MSESNIMWKRSTAVTYRATQLESEPRGRRRRRMCFKAGVTGKKFGIETGNMTQNNDIIHIRLMC